jgi:aryl-alcohol dehydrogenase-like predicted oxidoreductase
MRRRDFLALASLAASAAVAGAGRASGAPARQEPRMLTRRIPRTGEALPVIGLGTWSTFDVGEGAEARAPLRQVLADFLAAGGRVIDSSPMYGRAEAVVGDLLAALGEGPTPFLATKVWTSGKARGVEQQDTSLRRLRRKAIELMQVHNLVDVKTHLPVLRERKAAGVYRYVGITHYQLGAFDDLERLIRTESLDFVQLPYSIVVREAERRLLPAAAETGTAVLVMRPFEGGELFARVKGKPLPALAGELGCTSWAQLFLKFILGHPAVTCPIPATSKPEHLADNLRAGAGPLPDDKQRRALAAIVDGL